MSYRRALPLAIVAVGVGLRLIHLGRWPSGFNSTLEFDSANGVRTIFLSLTAHDQPWQQAWLAAHPGRFLEPPVLQALVALTYLPDGVERPWTVVLFAVAAWMAAAVILYFAARRLVGPWGALLGLAYLVLTPFGIATSVTFMVEPLVLLAFAGVVWVAVSGDVLEGKWFAIALLVGIAAAFVKVGVLLPFIAMAYIYTAASHGSLRDRSRLVRISMLLFLIVVPAVVYAVAFIPGDIGEKVIPGLLLTTDYYAGWFRNAAAFVGIVPLLGAAVGAVVEPRIRPLMAALGVAYLAYSAAFTWHTMTHDYYQLPLMLIVAIGLSGLGAGVARWAASTRSRQTIALTAVVVAIAVTIRMGPTAVLRPNPDYADAARLTAIGDAIGPGERVLALSSNYGVPLDYYGRLLVWSWPLSYDLVYEEARGVAPITTEQRLNSMIAGVRPHYFVLTLPASTDPELAALLASRYPVAAAGADWTVYDLQETAT